MRRPKASVLGGKKSTLYGKPACTGPALRDREVSLRLTELEQKIACALFVTRFPYEAYTKLMPLMRVIFFAKGQNRACSTPRKPLPVTKRRFKRERSHSRNTS